MTSLYVYILNFQGDFCVATYTTASQADLQSISRMADSWNGNFPRIFMMYAPRIPNNLKIGPMSVAVILNEATKEIANIEEIADKSQSVRDKVHFHYIYNQPKASLSTNYLRNVAATNCPGKYVVHAESGSIFSSSECTIDKFSINLMTSCDRGRGNFERKERDFGKIIE